MWKFQVSVKQEEVEFPGRLFKKNSCGFGVSFLFLALIWKFLTECGDINSIFHSDKISADSKC